IQPGGYAVSVHQSPEVEDILSEVARQQGAKLTFVAEEQLVECAICSLMEHHIVAIPSINNVSESLTLPGRLEHHEIARRKVLIDGGHTPASARRLLAEVDRILHFVRDPDHINLVVGMLADKAAHEFLAVFDASRFRITLTASPG